MQVLEAQQAEFQRRLAAVEGEWRRRLEAEAAEGEAAAATRLRKVRGSCVAGWGPGDEGTAVVSDDKGCWVHVCWILERGGVGGGALWWCWVHCW